MRLKCTGLICRDSFSSSPLTMVCTNPAEVHDYDTLPWSGDRDLRHEL